MSEQTVYIYVLCDPSSGEVRYVGKTVNPGRRLHHHCRDKGNTRRGKWIRSLSGKPEMVIIDECGPDWAEVETFWISYMRSMGFRLVNLTDGGEGCCGLKQTEDTRRRKAEYMLNMPESHRANHKAACNTPEYKRKQSEAQMRRPDKDFIRENMRRNQFDHRGFKYSDESRLKMSLSHKGVKHPPEVVAKRAAAIKAWWSERKKDPEWMKARSEKISTTFANRKKGETNAEF